MLPVHYSLHSHSINTSITVSLEKIVYLERIQSVAKTSVADTMISFIHNESGTGIYRIPSNKMDRSQLALWQHNSLIKSIVTPCDKGQRP